MLTFKTVQQAVRRLAFSADGSRVAAAGELRKVHVWNLTAKKHKRTVIPELDYWVSFLGFRPDGKLLAVGRFGQTLLHDPANPEPSAAAAAGFGDEGKFVVWDVDL